MNKPMEYTEEEKQFMRDRLESEACEMFGDAKARQRKNRRYVSKLVKERGEELIRAILVALSKRHNFIPAEELRELEVEYTTKPLSEILQAYDVPWFYFEKIEHDGETIRVDVSHGIPLAARGETFVFKKTSVQLEVTNSYNRWIS